MTTEHRLRALRPEVAQYLGTSGEQEWAAIAVDEAVAAGLEGNAAVGALLVGADGVVLHRDHNRMLAPRFRSDLHAEMVVLNAYEQADPDGGIGACTLFTSLEPCEMCLIRIINSGVGRVRYVAPDRGKGGLSGPNGLAPHWRRLAATQSFAPVDCEPRLAEIALEVFELTIGWVTDELLARRGVLTGGGGS